ncbi:MAG: KH domain-containing protein [Candidatus Diapherotrites archaeon]
MKSPLCNEELKNNSFCALCNAKIKQGLVSETDLKVLRKLQDMEKTLVLKDTEFVKAYEAGEFILIVCKGNVGALIGKGGEIVKSLSKDFGKKIRIVEHTNSEKDNVQNVLGNVRVLGMNKVFKPGTEETLLFIPKADEHRLPADKKTVETIISEINGKKTEISFK